MKRKSTLQEQREKISKNVFLLVILALTLIGLVFSLLIEYQNMRESKALDKICTATGSDCHSVQNSEYGKIFGIKVVHVGVISFFLFLGVVILQIVRPRKWTKSLLLLGATIAAGTGAYFIYTQAFILNHYCIYCLFIDSSSILILIAAIMYIYRANLSSGFRKH